MWVSDDKSKKIIFICYHLYVQSRIEEKMKKRKQPQHRQSLERRKKRRVRERKRKEAQKGQSQERRRRRRETEREWEKNERCSGNRMKDKKRFFFAVQIPNTFWFFSYWSSLVSSLLFFFSLLSVFFRLFCNYLATPCLLPVYKTISDVVVLIIDDGSLLLSYLYFIFFYFRTNLPCCL